MPMYSKTSNSDPSEKRTTSLQGTDLLPPIDFTIEYILNLWEADTSQLRTTDTDEPQTNLIANTKLSPITDSETTTTNRFVHNANA